MHLIPPCHHHKLSLILRFFLLFIGNIRLSLYCHTQNTFFSSTLFSSLRFFSFFLHFVVSPRRDSFVLIHHPKRIKSGETLLSVHFAFDRYKNRVEEIGQKQQAKRKQSLSEAFNVISHHTNTIDRETITMLLVYVAQYSKVASVKLGQVAKGELLLSFQRSGYRSRLSFHSCVSILPFCSFLLLYVR